MTKQLQHAFSEQYPTDYADDEVNYFYTHDMGCSAALISAGFQLVFLDKTNPRKVRFIFARKVGIDQAVNDYWSDKLVVNARTLFDNIKMLKNRIYSE
jgi:hypothetical protein